MKRMGFKDSRAFRTASTMPTGLKHAIDGQDFDWKNSEVLAWLLSQPEIAKYVFDKVNQSGAIIYESKTRTWRGSDFSPKIL